MKSALCEKLGIEFPLFAFSHCRDVIAQVSKAGGFGVLGAVGHSPESLEIELNWIDEQVGDKPYGVDLIVPTSLADREGNLTPEELMAILPSTLFEKLALCSPQKYQTDHGIKQNEEIMLHEAER